MDVRSFEQVGRKPTDHEVVKHRYSAFFDTQLAALLNSLNRTHLYLAA